MHYFIFSVAVAVVATQAQAMDPVSQTSADNIVITGSREPLTLETTPVSATIFDSKQLEVLAFPFVGDLLRLTPGVSVAASGPNGTQTQVRLRGAEANHTLLFIDGIRFNDPASGNEARFELFTLDSATQAEIVRGPQSALWGSEAIGGVVAIETADPLHQGFDARGEYGSLDSVRGAAQFTLRAGDLGFSGSGGWIQSDGIDSSGTGGERDGFVNRAAGFKAVLRPSPVSEIGVAGRWIEGKSDFDGFDPITFLRADTLDNSRNAMFALRGWAKIDFGDWNLLIDSDILHSANRNFLDKAPLNRTAGQRFTLGAQLSRQIGQHHLTVAVEHEAEDFKARDTIYFGGTDQDRSRALTAFVGEWRADWSPSFSTDIALRSDNFSTFGDTASLRVSALFRPAVHWQIHAAYGEGIAQPTFYDQFGFFPGFFIGNPSLKPENSAEWEVGLRWNNNKSFFAVTGFNNRLRDEIVDTFDPVTFLSSTANASGKSRRQGIELEARHAFSSTAVLAFNYTWLDASEQQVAGSALVHEVRRPRHSANALLTGASGALNWGASLAYVGKRHDVDFDFFPARPVVLGDYILVGLNLGYQVTPALEAYVRAENAFDADYQDVVGYHVAGRMIYAGLRFRLGR